MDADVAQRYRSRILREMQANRENPFNSPPSSTGSHGSITQTMSSLLSEPDGESTRRLNEDIARVTAGRKLNVNWEAAHRKWPDHFSKPKSPVHTTKPAPSARPLSAHAKENKPPAVFKFAQEDSTQDVWNSYQRKRSDMQPRVNDDSDHSIPLFKSPARNHVLSPITRAETQPQPQNQHQHQPQPQQAAQPSAQPTAQPQRRSSIGEALERLRRASISPRDGSREQMSGVNGSNLSSAKSSFTAVHASPNASPNSGSNARSFFIPDISHLGDFVTGTLRFSGGVKNGVPIFVKQGKVHDKQASPAAAKHAAIDSVKVPQDEERIFVSMDMIRDEIISLQEHHIKVTEYAAGLQEQVNTLEAELKCGSWDPNLSKGKYSSYTAEMNSRLHTEVAVLKHRLEKATRQLTSTELANDTISHEKDRVLTRLQEACDDISKLTRKLTVKEKELETSQQVRQDNDELRQHNDGLRQDNDELRRDNDRLRRSIDELREDMDSSNDIRDSFAFDVTSLRDNNDKLEKKVQTLQSQADTMRADNDRLRQQNQTLLAENKTLRTKVHSEDDVINEDLDEVQHELDVAREEIESLRKQNEELSALREDNNSLVRNNDKYFSDNKTLRREISGFERSVRDLHEQNFKLKEEVGFLKEQIHHYRPDSKANIEPTENMTSGYFMPDITLNTDVSAPAGPTETKDLPDPLGNMTGQSQNLTDADYTESVNYTNQNVDTNQSVNTNQNVKASQKKPQPANEQSLKVAFAVPSKPGVLKNSANKGSKRRAGSRQAHFENFSDYDETTGAMSVDNDATGDQAVELSVPVQGIFKPVGNRDQTPHPSKTKKVQQTMETDITTGTNKSTRQDISRALSTDAQRVLDGLCEHSCTNCIVCTRITSHRSSSSELAAGKKRVTVPRPVPVTDRELPIEEDATMRPSQSPGHALALVIKGLEDESRHLEMELAQQQRKYNSRDKSISRKDRIALAESIRSLLKSVEVKNDQVYSLYDVLEGQKAAGQAMTEEELEMTVLNITGMTVRDATEQLTWEGFQ